MPLLDPASSIKNPASSLRCGMVAVVGRANVGKSTLVNRLLGEKISMVSPVAQSTRNLIRGIRTEPRGQLVFLDTPGVHKSSHDLGRLMNRRARAAIEGVDIILLVFDTSTPPREEDEGWIRRLLKENTPCWVALNKADLGGKFLPGYKKLWSDLGREKAVERTPAWFVVSAQTGAGLDELTEAFFAGVPPGPLLFPEDILTDFPRKLAMADIIREKLNACLFEELPHSVAVFIDTINEQPDGWRVSGDIYVLKPSQKGIVIGHKGRVLRRVRRAAEKELAQVYEHPVQLDLRVRVEKNWTRNIWILKKLGYA